MIKWIQSKAIIILITLLVTSLLATGGIAYLYNEKAEALVASDNRVSELEASTILLETRLFNERNAHALLSSENVRIGQKFSDVRAQLNSFKGREQTVVEKPELVEALIQESFDELMIDIQCVTGDLRKCAE